MTQTVQQQDSQGVRGGTPSDEAETQTVRRRNSQGVRGGTPSGEARTQRRGKEEEGGASKKQNLHQGVRNKTKTISYWGTARWSHETSTFATSFLWGLSVKIPPWVGRSLE